MCLGFSAALLLAIFRRSRMDKDRVWPPLSKRTQQLDRNQTSRSKELDTHPRLMQPPYFFDRPGSTKPTTWRIHVPDKQKTVADEIEPPPSASRGGERPEPAPEAPSVQELATIEIVTARESTKRFARDRILTGPRVPCTTEIVAHPKSAMRQFFDEALPFSDFEIGAPPLPIDRHVVEQLMVSISEWGQTEPISIRRFDDGRLQLLGGWHRVTALKNLGRTSATALIISGLSDGGARLWQLVDNRHRKVFCAMDRAKHDFEILQAVQERVSQGAIPIGGRQPADKFHAKAAALLGTSADRMARSVKIAQITAEAESKIRELNLQDNQSALFKIADAGTTTESQIAKAIELRQCPKKGAKPKGQSVEGAYSEDGTTGSVTRRRTESAAISAIDSEAEAPELLHEGDPIGVEQRREDTTRAPTEPPYPDLPRKLERRPIDAALKKLADAYRSNLREMLIAAPIEARDRFIWEVLYADFPDAFVNALAREVVAGES
jgi:ParB-like chromosome segregation protein Spo0J